MRNYSRIKATIMLAEQEEVEEEEPIKEIMVVVESIMMIMVTI